MTPILTPPEAAEYLRMSVSQLLSLVRAGIVPCVRINQRVIRFRRDTLDGWMGKKESKGSN
jgi:excisionase family DNA binding protein